MIKRKDRHKYDSTDDITCDYKLGFNPNGTIGISPTPITATYHQTNLDVVRCCKEIPYQYLADKNLSINIVEQTKIDIATQIGLELLNKGRIHFEDVSSMGDTYSPNVKMVGSCYVIY